MQEDFIIKLTGSLYRVVEVFPEDVLKMAIKKEAVDILRNYFLKKSKDVLQGIDVLLSLLEVAENQNWAQKENFLVLQENYQKLQQGLLETFPSNSCNNIHSKSKDVAKPAGLTKAKENRQALDFTQITNERHKKILKFLQKASQGQIQDFKGILPEVSKRTLRRDMDQLLKLKAVKRIGDKNNTVYQMKS